MKTKINYNDPNFDFGDYFVFDQQEATLIKTLSDLGIVPDDFAIGYFSTGLVAVIGELEKAIQEKNQEISNNLF